jgi:tryptophan-rich sensory protein
MSLGLRGRAWAAAAVAAACVAVLGGLATEIGPWYLGLEQPAWKPPDWAFGPAWTLIYACTALAGAKAWLASPASARRLLIGAFLVNGVLNVTWSLLFFRLRRPDWALLEVGLLWLSVLALVIVCGRRSRAAGALLLPYLAWVAFAAALNAAVVRLNGPFGAVA